MWRSWNISQRSRARSRLKPVMGAIQESYVVIRRSHLSVFSRGHIPIAVLVPGTAGIMSTDMDPPIRSAIQNAKARHTLFVRSWVGFDSIRLPLPLDGVKHAYVVTSSER